MSERCLLDASALLVLLFEEKGANVVTAALEQAAISAANLSEVIAKLAERGYPRPEIEQALALSLEVLPVGETEAWEAGELRRLSRRYGLSLGDRLCLATAKLHKFDVVLTSNAAWLKLARPLHLKIVNIRSAPSASPSERINSRV